MNLSNIRLQKFTPLFDKILGDLMTTGQYDVGSFEQILSDGMSCSREDLKEFVQNLSRIKRYETIAVYYMEHSGLGPEPAVEFHDQLARFYGMITFASPGQIEARIRYWKRNLPESAGMFVDPSSN